MDVDSSAEQIHLSRKRETIEQFRRMVLAISDVFIDTIDTAILNALIYHTFLTEEEFVELLFIDISAVRSSLHRLKQYDLVDRNSKIETNKIGKSVDIYQYFINFKIVHKNINITLDHMIKSLDRKAETQINKKNFQCEKCETMFDNIQIITMYDIETDEMKCHLCNGNVNQLSRTNESTNTRQDVARFNLMIRNPLQTIINQCENITLPGHMVAPDFSVVEEKPEDVQMEIKVKKPTAENVTISFDETTDWNNIIKKTDTRKPYPEFLTGSVKSAYNPVTSNSVDRNIETKTKSSKPITNPLKLLPESDSLQEMAPGRIPGSTDKKDILSLLSQYESEHSTSLAGFREKLKETKSNVNPFDYKPLNIAQLRACNPNSQKVEQIIYLYMWDSHYNFIK